MNGTGFSTSSQKFFSSVIEGHQSVASRSDHGSFLMSASEFPEIPEYNLLVLYLDQEICIIYSCVMLENVPAEVIWVLSRARHPQTADVEQMEQKLKSFNLDHLDLIPIDQYDCHEPHFGGSETDTEYSENKRHKFLSLHQKEIRTETEEDDEKQRDTTDWQTCVLIAESLAEIRACLQKIN